MTMPATTNTGYPVVTSDRVLIFLFFCVNVENNDKIQISHAIQDLLSHDIGFVGFMSLTMLALLNYDNRKPFQFTSSKLY